MIAMRPGNAGTYPSFKRMAMCNDWFQPCCLQLDTWKNSGITLWSLLALRHFPQLSAFSKRTLGPQHAHTAHAVNDKCQSDGAQTLTATHSSLLPNAQTTVSLSRRCRIATVAQATKRSTQRHEISMSTKLLQRRNGMACIR